MRARSWLALTAVPAVLIGTALAGPQLAAATTSVPSAAAAAAGSTTVTVDTFHPGQNLAADFTGLSYEASILSTTKLDSSRGNLANLLKTLSSNGHLRFGGNLMDNDTWWQSGGQPVPSYAKSVLDRNSISRLNGLLTATGWKTELGVNLKHLDNASVSDEASYATSTLGSKLLGMACGNEPDLYPNYNYNNYKTSWLSCINSISKGEPLIGPNWSGTMPEQFLIDEGSKLSFAGSHYYPLSLCNGSTANLNDLLSQGTVGNESVKFGDDVSISGRHGKSFRMDETNSVSCGGAGNVSNVYGSALWNIDYSLLGAQMGVKGMNFHGGLDVCGNNYSALCSTNQSDLDNNIYSANPVYYGMYMVSRMSTGTFLPAGVDTNDVRAYVVRSGDGVTRVMLLQKSEVGGSPISVNVNGLGGTAAASAITLTGSALLGSASGIRVQGSQVGRDGTISVPAGTSISPSNGNYTVSVPTGSAVLLSIPTAGSNPPAVPISGSNLVGGASNKCVDISGYRTTDYVPVQLYPCSGGWNQKWQYTSGALTNPFDHKCLDVSGGRTTDGAAVQQWSCLGNAAQQWTFRSDGTLYNANSGKCLTAVGNSTADNTRLEIRTCAAGNTSQQWALR